MYKVTYILNNMVRTVLVGASNGNEAWELVLRSYSAGYAPEKISVSNQVGEVWFISERKIG